MAAEAHKPLGAIGRFLARQEDIRLGLVFGSVARASETADSDVDVAVFGDRPLDAQRRMQLIAGLARETGRPVDLVDLRSAGLPVARSALLGGKVVFKRNEADYPALLSRLLIDSADFLPYRDRVLKQRRDAWIK